nr:MAG TPA: hypothetical protein [Caudoviricetes sp.]
MSSGGAGKTGGKRMIDSSVTLRYNKLCFYFCEKNT